MGILTIEKWVEQQIELAEKYLLKYREGTADSETIVELSSHCKFIWLEVFSKEDDDIVLDIQNEGK